MRHNSIITIFVLFNSLNKAVPTRLPVFFSIISYLSISTYLHKEEQILFKDFG
jgi:hypothetical protein